MSRKDIVRAWKDEEYRLSLSEAERALLPANPAGLIEMTDIELAGTSGGAAGTSCGFGPCPSGYLSCGAMQDERLPVWMNIR